MTAPCKILRFPTERVRRPAPPPNPYTEAMALWWAWTANGAREWAKVLDEMSALMRQPR